MKCLFLTVLILVTNAMHLTWSELVDALESEVASRTKSQNLQDSVEDEEEVMAQGESSFFVRNKLRYSSVFVTYGCDRQFVKKESMEISGKITGKYMGASGSVESTYKNEKEFENAFISKTGATKVGPGGFLEEGVAKSCDMVYATMYVRKRDGKAYPFMNTSGVHKGKVVTISGTPENLRISKSWEACGGEYCGCWNKKCWTTCATGWCYASDSYSQSFSYKSCRDNSHCTPGLKCAGSCHA